MNKEKIIELLRKNNCDAIILSDEANMHYLCKFSPCEGRILVTVNGNAYHLVDSRYTEKAQQNAKITGLKVIEINKSFIEQTKELCEKHKVKTLMFENETISLQLFETLQENLPSVQLVKLNNQLMMLRNVKDKEEIDLIKTANNIAEKSFLELLNHIKVGKSEKELAAYFDYLMAKNGSDGVSFQTILLSGLRTSMPHGVPSENKINSGDFVLFDFGATYNGYHSDMTRTIAVDSASDEMKDCYYTVLKAQLAGINALKSGALCKDVYKAANDVLMEKDLSQYFRHSLGHGVGLEIHEGFNASPKSVDTFEIGNVTSIEPGIYIPNKFGIRIEDLLYIDESGTKNFSTIDKELIII